MPRDKQDEWARSMMQRIADEAIASDDPNQSAKGRMLKNVLIPFVDWLDEEVKRGVESTPLLSIIVTGFASSVGMSLLSLWKVKTEGIEEVASLMTGEFFAELVGVLHQADMELCAANHSIN